MNNQEEQARRIVELLDDSTQQVSAEQRSRLAEARKLALERYHHEPVLAPAWAGAISGFTERPLFGVRYVIPVAALVLGLLGVAYVHNGGLSNDTADIDVGLLTDELPIDAYLDQGFDSWLKRSSR